MLISSFYFYLIYFLILIISGIVGIVFKSKTVFGDFSLGFFCSSVASILLILIKDIQNMKQLLLSFRIYFYIIIFPKRKIRVAMASLFKILIDNNYLLITNERRGTVAPIGGVYKYFPESEQFLNDIGAHSEIEGIPNNTKNLNKYEKDLRLLFPLKELPKFLQWFDSGNDREHSPMREFYEELIDTKLISTPSHFRNIRYSRHKRFRIFDKYSPSKNHYDLHHFDIFNVYLTEEQKNKIKEIVETTMKKSIHLKLFLVTRSEIEKGRLSNGLELGNNAKFIL